MNYSFDSADAVKYGVDEAVMLANIKYWIRRNIANEKSEHDGRVWTYNSRRAFIKLFPFWSDGQIKRIINSLVKQGAIIKGNYNQAGYDRTSWFALATKEEENELLPANAETDSLVGNDQAIGRNQPIARSKSTNPSVEIDQPIPDNKPDNKLNTIKHRGKKRFSPPNLDSVREYIIEKGYNVDADKFINYYTSNGWMVGKNKMKEWKAAVRTWNSNGNVDKQKRSMRNRDETNDDEYWNAVDNA